jgi:hypothetical protein
MYFVILFTVKFYRCAHDLSYVHHATTISLKYLMQSLYYYPCWESNISTIQIHKFLMAPRDELRDTIKCYISIPEWEHVSRLTITIGHTTVVLLRSKSLRQVGTINSSVPVIANLMAWVSDTGISKDKLD